MYMIDFHSDDYGISPNNSKRILELVKGGHLESFSIIPNMSYYAECMELLKKEWNELPKKPLISIHINLVDGNSLSGRWSHHSWGEIFMANYSIGKKRTLIYEDIKAEISAQINRVFEDIKDLEGFNGKLRLDSHVHTHMIPIVFDAMMAAVEGRDVEYVRLSKEPLCMFYSTAGVRGTFPFINVIKNIILRFYSHRVSKYLITHNIEHGLIWGLIMSGYMDGERMKKLMPKMEKYAAERNAYLEIFGHVGIVLKDEAIMEEYSEDDRMFFLSDDRNVEFHGMEEICL